MKVKFLHWECEVIPGKYLDNNSKAISLVDLNDREPIAKATVNVPGVIPPIDCVFIKAYSENEGMAVALIDAGVIEPEIHGEAETGYITVNMYRLTSQALELWKD